MTGDEHELLMRYLDGEMTREEARAFDKRLAQSPELETAMAALTQVREVVAARYARAAEEAGPELDRLWSKIEAGMDAPAPAPTPGLWDRFTDGIRAWFEQYRGHVAVGAACGVAGVVLALSLIRVPGGREIVYLGGDEVPREVAVGGVNGGGVALVADANDGAEIESLEVEGGSGTIFRIPADDGTAPTTVIWVTRDEEGPI